MKVLGMTGQFGSSWAKFESERSTLVRRAVRWGLVVLLPVLVVGSLTTTRAFGQEAQISGIVSDSSGARAPNVNVTVVNRDTGISRSVDSNTDGFYSVPLLQPGNYTITAKKDGFATQVRTGITLEVGAQQVIDLTLQVGSMNQKVVVTETPTVELASSTVGGTANATMVRELPLNGRDWTQLATLQPGVTSMGSLQPGLSGTTSTGRVNRGFGTEVAISGARPQQNNYRTDGITVNSYSNDSPGGVTGAALGVDAIAEFSVLTSNYSAEYGRTSGGVINAITRSGTSQLHGDVYEFLRNSALDARNFFDPATKPEFRRNQFGGSVGGPIWKEHTFFFVDYEGMRQSLGITNLDTVPSQDARNGILHNADGTTTIVTVDPLVKSSLRLWALPNAGLLGTGDTGLFSFTSQQVTTANFWTARVDHKFSEADSLFGSYQFDNGVTTLPDNLNDVLTNQLSHRQFVALEENHVFSPRLVNSVRVGFNRDAASGGGYLSAINPAAKDPSLAGAPGEDAPQTIVSGISPFGGGLSCEHGSVFVLNSFQGYDDVFLTEGIHSLKFGVAVERIQNNSIQAGGLCGMFTFGSLANFLTNQADTYSSTIASTITPRGLRQSIFGGYVQDDVRWRPNLTLNLGLRYEMSTVPTEVHGELSTLPNVFTGTTLHLGNPYFSNPTLRNFEPRIGFAWDPFRNGKTAVRGGFGFFDVLPLTYEYVLPDLSAAPFALDTQSRASTLQGLFPGGAFSSVVVSTTSERVTGLENNPHRSYVMQWNLNVQRELRPNLMMTVAYVGSRGVHQLFRADDMDMVLPTKTPAGYLWPSPVGSGTVMNPFWGRIDDVSWGSNSFYDALELQILKKISHGFQIQGSYTWGKSIDEGSGSLLGDPFSNSISNLFWFDRRLRRAVSDFNIGQNLVVNYSWTIPTAQSLKGAAAWALKGWQLGGILQANTGLPFTPLIGGDPLGNLTKDFDFPNRIKGPGCQSGVNPGNPNNYIKLSCFSVPNPINLLGNAGRNSLVGPGLVNFDLSLFKNTHISERFNAQFRMEFFNVFNRANFVAPNDNNAIFNPDGTPVGGAGLIDTTSTTAREIQFAIKLIW